MSNVIHCKTHDGRSISFVDQIIGSGAMKDVYFSPDKSYVVCFFNQQKNKFYSNPSEYQEQKRRLLEIVTTKHDNLMDGMGGEYWKNTFCWPNGLVEYNNLLGIVAPSYSKEFFFEYGSSNNDSLNIKGKEKEGKWFASASNQNRFLDDREKGDWSKYLKICVTLARSIRRMHAAGLAHSDLSYKNVLIDPTTGKACVIDVDGLVVPGKFPPEVVGTPDFIAPEVIATSYLDKSDPKRFLPSIRTDRHALAVLIYMYLLYRHPLRGKKVHDLDDSLNDEKLSMGERALFVEHSTNNSNRINTDDWKKSYLPWVDTNKIPYTVTGPYLSELFKKCFEDHLHDPNNRPSAEAWEIALTKTTDLLQPCMNSQCNQKWFVFDNSTKPHCPFCGTAYTKKLPILNLYSTRNQKDYKSDNHRLMVWSNQSLFEWHTNSLVLPNERLQPHQMRRLGYFVEHKGQWWLVNERMNSLFVKDSTNQEEKVEIGGRIELKEGVTIILSKESGGRLAYVQMSNN